ncbi:hypothetical protein LBW62_25675 [Ralstonia solanacearum]|uniref:hypothetical protein n=1 Tax=Ralstonia solanacearum TaxID=305 RepID=UPI002305AC24|nr:hypothetical protein [Ralstonia solanacearum]MDB0544628.1 hypothetical protein [Ralstonia solanacearum]MDB0554443.1 hypothetical protein [Ralstonia solanacearum]MDB0559551.1 hypothetical protein [Ralstonia solanacearum]
MSEKLGAERLMPEPWTDDLEALDLEIVRRVWAHLQPRIGDQLGRLPNPGPLPTA